MDEENNQEEMFSLTTKGRTYVEAVLLKEEFVYKLIEMDESKFDEAWDSYVEFLIDKTQLSFKEYFKDEIARPTFLRELDYENLSDSEKEKAWRKVTTLLNSEGEELE